MPDHANDQVAAIDRLNCPSCGVGFAIPKDLDKFKGKRSKCQVCAKPFRFSADGRSLAAIVEAPTPPPAAPTPLPGQAAFPELDLGADRPPRDEPAPRRPVVPWATAAVALAALVPTLWLALGSSKKEGTIRVELESPVADVTLSVDDKPVTPEQLKAPLTLAVGPHRLSASGRGLVAFQGILPVFEGANPPFPLKLAAVPKPVEVAVATPEGGAAAKAGPRPEAAAGVEVAAAASPADGAPEVTGDMASEKVEADPAVVGDTASEKVEADPAVVGDMASEKVEADPAVVGDMASEKVEADPSIVGPEPKAGPKSDATLKQVASDPGSYLDTSVIPSDLLLIDTGAVGGPSGRRPGSPDLRLVVKSREGAYRDAMKPGTSFEIRLADESAAAIRDQVRSGNLVGGEYPAIVKFKMTKDPAKPDAFVGLVEWVELLVYVDPRHIFNGKSQYNKVFTVVRVADDRAEIGISKSYQGWQKRLVATGIISKLKVAYRQAFTINRGVEYDQLIQQIRSNLPAIAKVLHDRQMSLLRGH